MSFTTNSNAGGCKEKKIACYKITKSETGDKMSMNQKRLADLKVFSSFKAETKAIKSLILPKIKWTKVKYGFHTH